MASTPDTDYTLEPASKPQKELAVVIDEGLFFHSTRDTYKGFFEATKKTHTIKMQGYGIYVTAEGEVYSGMWDNDKLGNNDGNVRITFVDSSTYTGPLKNWYFAGSGKYLFPDESVLEAEFIDNCPYGNMRFIDPNGHVWLGKAEKGFGWFEPVNHFYAMLEKRESLKSNRQRKIAI